MGPYMETEIESLYEKPLKSNVESLVAKTREKAG